MSINSQLILSYEHFFNDEPPDNRLDLISKIPKQSVLYEIIGLNHRIKPSTSLFQINKVEFQLEQLQIFLPMNKELLDAAKMIFLNQLKNGPATIFNRPACLFAIEEILSSEIPEEIKGFKMAKEENWEAIFKYYLLVNHKITQIKKEDNETNISFETLNPKVIPINELVVDEDFFISPYRSSRLLKFMSESAGFGEQLVKYLDEVYGLTIHEFLGTLVNSYHGNRKAKEPVRFHYQVPENHEHIPFFEALSKRGDFDDTFKLIGLRKAPFIKVGHNKYALSDSSFLIAKGHTQLLNDFWFDYLKPAAGKDSNKVIKEFKSLVGAFIENYIREILEGGFKGKDHWHLYMFDDLKVNKPQEIEIADIYLRNSNKIWLAEVKGGAIYDNQKFGGDIEALYKGNREEFFNNFGVNQIVEHIVKMQEHIHEVDKGYDFVKSKRVFPCIIVNDHALVTPLMAEVFNQRFKELLDQTEVGDLKVERLSLISLNDLESLEYEFNLKPGILWKLLRTNVSKAIVPPFFNSINHHIKGRRYPKKVIDFYKSIIQD